MGSCTAFFGGKGTPQMTRPTISGVSPFFIVANVPATLSFYRDKLGFKVTFRGPSPRAAAEPGVETVEKLPQTHRIREATTVVVGD